MNLLFIGWIKYGMRLVRSSRNHTNEWCGEEETAVTAAHSEQYNKFNRNEVAVVAVRMAFSFSITAQCNSFI